MTKVAIIGTGGIAKSHIEAFRAFPGRCEITALTDIYPEKAQSIKKQLGLKKAKVYGSHNEIAGNADIDLVSICTPPYSHAQITIDCLNAGKHVIVEKPMAASLEECDAMIEAAEASGRVFSVIAQNRFRDPVMGLKRALDSGLIGKVVHVQVDSFWWRGHSYYDLWWRGLWEKEGGGCTLNHAVHHIDMLCWMMGRPLTVSAVISNAAHDNSEVEDISVAVLQYSGGALAQVTSSVVHHGQAQQIIFQGERARISMPWKVHASISKTNGFPEYRRDRELEGQILAARDSSGPLEYIGHIGQIDDVLSAVEEGRAPLVSGQDGRNTIETITAIYKAAAEQRSVNLPIGKSDPFYTVEGIMASVPRFYEKNTSVTELEGKITV